MKHAAVLMTLDGTHKVVPLEDEVMESFQVSCCLCILQAHTHTHTHTYLQMV